MIRLTKYRAILVVVTICALTSCTSSRVTAQPASAHTISPSAPALTSDTSTPANTAHGLGTVVGPWAATLVSLGDFLRGSLVSDGTYLYALTGHAVVRSDPITGRQLSVSVSGYGGLIIAGNYLWFAPIGAAAKEVTLQRFALPALTPSGRETVTVTSMNGHGAAMVATADGSVLYVGGGATVAVIDPRRMQVIKRLTVAHPSVTGLALSPDDTTLYVGTDPGGGAQGTIDTFSLPTGTRVRTQPGTLGMGTVLATHGGLWEVGGTGHANPVSFSPFSTPTTLKPEPSGGGGIYPTVTATRKTVWIGGLALNCMDADTGTIKAAANLQDRSGVLATEISDVTAAKDRRLYAIYVPTIPPGPAGLVLLHPPARCDR